MRARIDASQILGRSCLHFPSFVSQSELTLLSSEGGKRASFPEEKRRRKNEKRRKKT
jgi:hypothetical protein